MVQVPGRGAGGRPHLLLEWEGGTLADMVADAAIAIMLQVGHQWQQGVGAAMEEVGDPARSHCRRVKVLQAHRSGQRGCCTCGQSHGACAAGRDAHWLPATLWRMYVKPGSVGT